MVIMCSYVYMGMIMCSYVYMGMIMCSYGPLQEDHRSLFVFAYPDPLQM